MADTKTKSRYRLPETVTPVEYDIEITPDLAAATFSGRETIEVEVHESTGTVTVNSAAIAISSAVAVNSTGTRLEAEVSYDEELQLAILKFTGTLGRGKWHLELVFTGILDPKLRGFYRSTWKDADGKEHYIATTKFEPSDARRAFPCFDEPSMKAVFRVSLVVDKELVALSNMETTGETTLASGKKKVSFAPSIVMSSYLVFYAVGPFVSSEPVQVRNTTLRVWSVPGKKHMYRFPLEAGAFSLTWLGDYFGLDYPSAKLDLIAIPDFASGAMENYGAVTFRETALLVDESRATQAELERVAEVVAHEIAHMWFGDLITMRWWNGLWLNEAFATFLAAKVTDAFRPDWLFWESFNTQKAAAMRVDGLCSTRTIEFPVETPEQARSMFDILTYEKGCSILRMLELYIGEETMRQGMRIYVKRHAYGNTETADLWSAIAAGVAECGKAHPVEAMMTGWVFQAGYPTVDVKLADIEGCVVLSQSLFKYMPVKDTALWHLPVNLRVKTASGWTSQTVMLDSNEKTVYVAEGIELVVANAEGAGYMRVAYSDKLRQSLLDNLGELSSPERFNLISDLWASVLAGRLRLSDYLLAAGQLTTVFGESDPNVWSVITGSLTYLKRALGKCEPEASEGMVNLARSMIMPALAKLTMQSAAGESAQTGQLRASLVSILGTIGDTRIQGDAGRLFLEHLDKPGTVSANLVPALVDCVAASGDAAQYDKFLSLRSTAATPQEETRYLMALAGIPGDELAVRTLTMITAGEIRTQDAPAMILKLFANPGASRATWKFVRENWDTLVKLLPLQGVIRITDGLPLLADKELEDEARVFFAEHKVSGSEKALAQNLELMAIAASFRARELGSFQELLLTGYAGCVR